MTASVLILHVLCREEQPRQAGQRAWLLVRLAGSVAVARVVASARVVGMVRVLDLAGDAPLIGVACCWRAFVGGQCRSSVVLWRFLR